MPSRVAVPLLATQECGQIRSDVLASETTASRSPSLRQKTMPRVDLLLDEGGGGLRLAPQVGHGPLRAAADHARYPRGRSPPELGFMDRGIFAGFPRVCALSTRASAIET